MSILTRWLLIPPVNARLIGRYREYRRHGASPFSATLGCFWLILAWVFIPLEHPRWQRIRAEHKKPLSAYQRRAPASAGSGPLCNPDLLVVNQCFTQRNGETALAFVFTLAEYSWSLSSMDG